MSLILRALLTASTLALMAGDALAASGPEVITQLDQAAVQPTDEFCKYEAITEEPGKDARTMVFTVQIKGEQRLVEFLAPGDMKGTRVLIQSYSQMYVYTPAYKKVRRIASHVNEQGFMGTTLSNADMSTAQFAPVYDAALKDEGDEAYVLTLTPKDAKKAIYGKLEMTIRKDIPYASEIRYFNDSGEQVKTETRGDYTCEGTICNPATITMTDHTRGDMSTTLKRSEWGVNTGVGDDVFSVRNLQRGG